MYLPLAGQMIVSLEFGFSLALQTNQSCALRKRIELRSPHARVRSVPRCAGRNALRAHLRQASRGQGVVRAYASNNGDLRIDSPMVRA